MKSNVKPGMTGRPKRVGEIVAEHIAACREKYGRYPVPKGMKPLPGKSKVKIPELPDYAGMKESEYNKLVINREDERRRHNRILPRDMRLMTYARMKRRGISTGVQNNS